MTDSLFTFGRRTLVVEPCPYCKGAGFQVRYVASRFAGCEYQAHETSVVCWACGGRGSRAEDAHYG